MRKVYYTLDLAEAVLLRDYFVQNGIGAAVQNKGAVRIPHEGIALEVWVCTGQGFLGHLIAGNSVPSRSGCQAGLRRVVLASHLCR